MRVSQAKDARHEQIVSILLQMYSSASSIYVMRAKAGRPREQIDQPCLCLLGTAVPKHFYEALSSRLLTNGFLARFLVLECGGRGQGRDDQVTRPVPDSIRAAARWWADFQPGGNLDREHPKPRLVSTTPDAAAYLFAFRKWIDDTEYLPCHAQQDEAGMAVWARCYEKARRLALIYACSVQREEPVISLPAAEWACALALHQTRRMLYMARHYAAESEFDAKRKRLLEVLHHWRRQHGDAWMPFFQLNRRLPWPSREHEEVRQTLLDQRLIEVQTLLPGRKGGRPGLAYRLAQHGGNQA